MNEIFNTIFTMLGEHTKYFSEKSALSTWRESPKTHGMTNILTILLSVAMDSPANRIHKMSVGNFGKESPKMGKEIIVTMLVVCNVAVFFFVKCSRKKSRL